MAAIGIVILVYGADFLIRGAVKLAQRARLSETVIGATIIAAGTSLPELAAAISAAVYGTSELVIGNVVGSNVANVGLVLGALLVCCGFVVRRKEDLHIDRVTVVGTVGACIATFAVSIDGAVSFVDGVVLIVCMMLIILWMTIKGRRKQETVIDKNAGYSNGSNKEDDKEETLTSLPSSPSPSSLSSPSSSPSATTPKRMSQIKTYQQSPYRVLFFVVIGALMLYIGSILTVDNAIIVAERIGISEYVIGATVIAIGTSLPELAAILAAVRRRALGIGVAGIFGSVIFNVFLVMGAASLVIPLMVSQLLLLDYLIMSAFCAGGVISCVLMSKNHKRVPPLVAGIVLLTVYTVWIISLAI